MGTSLPDASHGAGAAASRNTWRHRPTKLIRVPVVFAQPLLKIARRWDVEATISVPGQDDTYPANQESCPGTGTAVPSEVESEEYKRLLDEHTAIQANLEASERRFRAFMDNLPAVAFIKDADSRCLYANRSVEELFKVKLDEIQGKTDLEWLGDPEMAAEMRKHDLAVLAGEGVVEVEENTPLPDGGSRRWSVLKFPFADGTGNRLIGGLAFDTTEQEQAAQAIREREVQLQLFVEHTPAAVAMLDRNMRYILTSRRWLSDHDLEDRPIIGHSHYEVFPEIPERWKEIHQRCLAGAVERCEENAFVRTDGTVEWLGWEVRPWYVAGQIGGIVLFTEMLTARKRAEGHLRVQLATARALMEANTLEEVAGSILRAGCLDAGWDRAEMWVPDEVNRVVRPIGRWCKEPIGDDRFDREGRTLEFGPGVGLAGRVWACGQPVWISDLRLDHNFLRAESAVDAGLLSGLGVPVVVDRKILAVMAFFSCTRQPLDPQHLEPMVAIGAQVGQFVERLATRQALTQSEARFRMLSEERTRQLEAQLKAVERLDALKDDFLSTVSHELRTPIANMKLAIWLMKNSSDPQKSNYYLNLLEKECQREMNLVNDLLNLQRLEEEDEWFPVTLNLHEWIPPLVEPFRARAHLNLQPLEVVIHADVPPLATATSALERVLTELLNNACKYTPSEGRISLRVEPGRVESSEVQSILFSVKNTGASIPESELTNIFKKFYRVAGSDANAQPGTGLGLALVKRLVEWLGGDIKVESNSDRTCFTVELPLQHLRHE